MLTTGRRRRRPLGLYSWARTREVWGGTRISGLKLSSVLFSFVDPVRDAVLSSLVAFEGLGRIVVLSHGRIRGTADDKGLYIIWQLISMAVSGT